jgi:hypothetical protein
VRRRLVLVPVVVAATAAVATGCGAHGQPDALEACKAYTNATTGAVGRQARDVGLASAERWAGKAVAKADKWQPLLDGLRQYRAAVDGVGAGAGRSVANAKAVIQNTCETAARGY